MRYNMRMKRERRTPPRGPMVRCPKCKAEGENVYLIELWKNSSAEFDQNADGTIEKEGVLREGDPYKVQANCGCGHRWTLRGITQIVNLPGHPDHDFTGASTTSGQGDRTATGSNKKGKAGHVGLWERQS